MIPPLPVLQDYDISPDNGFLPPELPLTRLPDAYYKPWELVIESLPELISTKTVRAIVDRVPELSTNRLRTENEWRRAYVLLGFIAHGYIWGGEKPKDRLPSNISTPLLRTAEHFEIPPVTTYATVCLWNFRPVFSTLPIDRIDNLSTLCSFTGSIDEQWFYLVSTAIEARGAPTIPLMLAAMAAARSDDSGTVAECLSAFAERIEDLRDLLSRMYEHCSPEAFYFRIRPLLAGSKNMADAGLPHGVIYEEAAGNTEYRQYSGGSNAQSSLIQFFDLVLGVEHRPTGFKRNKAAEEKQEGVAPPPKHNFIQEMRSYMPGSHRRFLEHVATVANIRDYVEAHRGDSALAGAYDECLRALSSFRDKHMQIVSRYIVIQAQAAKRKQLLSPSSAPPPAPPASSPYDSHLPAPTTLTTATTPELLSSPTTAFVGLARSEAAKQGLVGTGGTKLIPFLKQSRDETMEPATAPWSMKHGMGTFDSFRIRRTPASTPRARSPVKAPGLSDDRAGARTCRVGEFDDFLVPPARVGVGMAGDWEMESSGGLCFY